jgi:hypothetical protein
LENAKGYHALHNLCISTKERKMLPGRWTIIYTVEPDESSCHQKRTVVSLLASTVAKEKGLGAEGQNGQSQQLGRACRDPVLPANIARR